MYSLESANEALDVFEAREGRRAVYTDEDAVTAVEQQLTSQKMDSWYNDHAKEYGYVYTKQQRQD